MDRTSCTDSGGNIYLFLSIQLLLTQHQLFIIWLQKKNLLNIYSLGVYHALCRFANNDTTESFPSLNIPNVGMLLIP